MLVTIGTCAMVVLVVITVGAAAMAALDVFFGED